MVKKVYKYGSGQKIPEGAVYLCSKKNGIMRTKDRPNDYKYVWHYFLVEVEEDKNGE